MKSFPKKYTPKELRNRSTLFIKSQQDNKNFKYDLIFTPNYIHLSKKLIYSDFFSLYLKDFYNCKKNIETIVNWEWEIYSDLFLISNDLLKNTSNTQKFFIKKNQKLIQVWTTKLERRLNSVLKKNLIANNKILENFFFSSHKYILSDSNFYIYVLNQLRNLREKWKINHTSNIGYRSIDLQTSIPNKYIIRKEEKIPCYTLKYFVGAKCEALPVCVDDIDSCCWDVALLVHPKDKRYNKHIWKNAIIPLSNRQIPIIWDENVNISINNWIKRICPCFDQESIELAKKYWLPTNIYVFNHEGIYTKYIWYKAFIWQERSKYYDNVEWLIKDIWNCAEESTKIVKIPYLNYTNERLFLYKIDQTIINVEPEKQKIIDDILGQKIHFSFLDNDFSGVFSKIENIKSEIQNLSTSTELMFDEVDYVDSWENNSQKQIQILNDELINLKQIITDELNKYIPNSIICNSQLSYWWRLPFIKWLDGTFSFFDLENQCLQRKEKDILICFNFVLLSLVRAWVLWTIKIWYKDEAILKLCTYDKFLAILSQNEKKIEHFIEQLESITWKKPEYEKFIKIIQNLTDENNPTINDCKKLLEKSKFISIDQNQIILNYKWILSNEIIDFDFTELCMICYVYQNHNKINSTIIHNYDERSEMFQQILIQQVLLWDTIFRNFLEYSYDQSTEFLWEKQLSKSQIEHFQWNLFPIYWENPIRLNLIMNQTYDQKEIILNNIFLKQIRNALRLCIQKKFLPTSIDIQLQNQPKEFNESDLFVLYNLNIAYNERKNIKSIDEYVKFFYEFKTTIQNLFFSRYLEIQKIHASENVQFVCSYFFCLLLDILYPLIPEFINAICYVSNINFIIPIKDLTLDKSPNFSTNTVYDTFVKIKQLKIDSNIKQHEFCDIFIKCNPSLLNNFKQYEQIFMNYFHITDLSYIMPHEQNLLWYDTLSNNEITIWIRRNSVSNTINKDSIESIENNLKNLSDKLDLLRQRIQFLPEWPQRKKAEEEYANTKEEIENLTIKHSLLSSK